MSRRSLRLLLPALLVLLTGCSFSVSPPAVRLPDSSLVNQAALAPCPTTVKGAGSVPGGLPKVTLHCLGTGPSVNLAHLRGPAIINAWYSACEPCRIEAPILAQFAAKAGGKVLVLGVDSEAYPNPGLTFAHDNNLHFAMLTDQHSNWAIGHFPSTYFLDAAGHLVGEPLSPIASLPQLEDAVRLRLGVTVR